jgi:uncharacterized damage-inducible protein DinB
LLDPHPLRHLLLCTLQQAREEIDVALASHGIWERPGGAGSLGFHARHVVGSLDRLLTYAEGGALSEAQLTVLSHEADEMEVAALQALVEQGLAQAEERVRALELSDLAAVRHIGRARIAVPLGTLLGHIAEHTQRHLGQMAVVRRMVSTR